MTWHIDALLSLTFGAGVAIAGLHVINRKFIAPIYDVVLNLIAFTSACTASTLLGQPVSAVIAAGAVLCWVWLGRRTALHLRRLRKTVIRVE